MKKATLVFLMAITAFTFVLDPQTVEASCQERVHAQHNGTVYYRDNRNLGWMHNDRNVGFLNQSRPPAHSDYYPPNQPSSVINRWGTSGWIRSGGDTWAGGIQDSFTYTPRTQLVHSNNGPHGSGYYFRADSGNLNRYRRPVMVNYHRDVTHPDTSPPTINASPTSSDWTRSVTVSLSFSDVGCSGYRDHRIQWTTSTSRPTSGWSSWAGHSSRNYTSPSGASGVRYLHVEARDNNNNVAYRRLGPFHLDNQPPNVSASPSSTDWTTSAIQVSLSFSDAHSGFRRYRHAWTTSTATPSSWSSWSTNASPTLTAPTQQGTWYLHVQVEDQVGNTDTRSFGPYRKNNAPVANFSWSPTTIHNNTTVTFNNTSSDPDGDTLTYRWEFQAPGSNTWTQFSTAVNPSRVFNQQGTWQIRLTVTDPFGGTHSRTQSLTVQNRSPVANFSWSPTTIHNNTTVTFNNTSSDPDGDTLTYRWEFQAPGSNTWTQFSTAINPSRVFNQQGTWQIRLTVTDPFGASHTRTQSLTVQNRSPVANFSWSPSTIHNNTTVTFNNTSSDPDGDTLTYRWEFQAPGSNTWTEFSTAANPSRVFNQQGTWQIRLTATDPYGATHTRTHSLTVQNRSPVANFSWSPSTIYNNTTVTFNNTSSDPDGDSLTYRWEFQAPGSNTWTQFSTAVNPSRVFNQQGAWQIRLTVTDPFGGTHSRTQSLTVQNRSPVANFSWSPTTIHNNTTVTFNNTSNDPDGDTLTYRWEFQAPGSNTWTQFSTAANPSRVFNQQGTWQIRLTVTDPFGGTHSRTQSLTVQNRSPVANFSWSPTTIHNNTTVTFNNTSSDPDGDTLTYRWEFQAPGSSTWTQFSTAANPSRVFNQQGTWQIRLTVTDPFGASHSRTQSLTVQNRNPVANFSWSPSTIHNNTTVTFNNTSSDPDGDTLTYRWEFQAPGSNTWTQFSTAINPSRVFNQQGTWQIRLTVTDPFGATHSRTQSLTVQNRNPVANFSWSPSTIHNNTTVTFNNTSSDPDGDTLTYRWEFQAPGSSTWTQFSTVANPSRVFNQQGTWQIRLTVTDPFGASNTRTQSLTVQNRSPVANFSWSPTTIHNNTTVTFNNTSSDPDGDTLTYRWEFQAPGSSTWTQFSTVANPSRVFNQQGTWQIRLTVTDPFGASNTRTQLLTVQNRNPVANFSWSPSTIYNNTTVNFNNTSSDPDGDTLTYRWEFQAPGSNTWTQFSTVANPSRVFNQQGTWQIRLTVTDPYGATHSRTQSLTVQNRNPVANFSWSPSTIYNNTTVTFNNTSSDPDGDTLTYRWEFQAPGSSTWTQFSTVANPSRVFNQQGTWQIRLTATDPFGGTHSRTQSLTVQNRSPVANFTWTPSTIFNNTTVTFNNTSSDPDGDTLTYRWEFQAPGSSTWTQFSTAANPSRVFNQQGTWQIRLTVTDPYGASNTRTQSLTVQNRNPVANFSWSPSTIYNNTTVNFNNTSSDPDGDTLTYRWEFQAPGSNTWTQFSTVANPSRVFNQQGTWQIRLTVTDPFGASHSRTQSLTVQNRNPVANFSWSPSTIYNNTQVSFSNTSSDPDGDTLTYRWEFQAPGSNTWTQFSTVANPSRVFNQQGTWQIRLTVTDPYGATHSRTQSLTVQNRNPVANFSWSPSTIYNNTTVTFNNTSSDPDGDSLTYRWEFQAPGSSTWTQFSTAANPSRVFNQQGTWQIRLTVTDPFGGTHSRTQSLTVQNRSPVANFNWSPSTIYHDTEVRFTNLSTDPDGDSLTYRWEFRAPGSNTWTQFSTMANPTRVFNIKGTWQIRLTVTDPFGASHTRTQSLTVQNLAPVADFTWTPLNPREDDEVQFINKSRDPDDPFKTLRFEWRATDPTGRVVNMGDSADSTFVFDRDGMWQVTLTVTDPDGAKDEKTVNIFVQHIFEASVKHVPSWEERRSRLGLPSGTFFAGEPFLLEAKGSRRTKTITVLSPFDVGEKRITLSQEGEVWSSVLFDPQFAGLEEGEYTFVFEFKTSDGRTHTEEVTVQISGRLDTLIHLTK